MVEALGGRKLITIALVINAVEVPRGQSERRLQTAIFVSSHQQKQQSAAAFQALRRGTSDNALHDAAERHDFAPLDIGSPSRRRADAADTIRRRRR